MSLRAFDISSRLGTKCTYALGRRINICIYTAQTSQNIWWHYWEHLFPPLWGQLTSQWRKCSIKLHYFSGRAANYDSVDKSDQVCNNLAPSFMFASVLIFFANWTLQMREGVEFLFQLNSLGLLMVSIQLSWTMLFLPSYLKVLCIYHHSLIVNARSSGYCLIISGSKYSKWDVWVYHAESVDGKTTPCLSVPRLKAVKNLFAFLSYLDPLCPKDGRMLEFLYASLSLTVGHLRPWISTRDINYWWFVFLVLLKGFRRWLTRNAQCLCIGQWGLCL